MRARLRHVLAVALVVPPLSAAAPQPAPTAAAVEGAARSQGLSADVAPTLQLSAAGERWVRDRSASRPRVDVPVGGPRRFQSGFVDIWRDECGDATYDLAAAGVLREDFGPLEFLFTGCANNPGTARASDLDVAYLIDVDLYDPNFEVDYLVLWHGDDVTWEVVRTPDGDDTSTWYQVWSDDGFWSGPDATYPWSQGGADVDTWMLGGNDEFFLAVLLLGPGDGDVDAVPEDYENLLLYPASCDYIFFSATVTTEPDAFEQVAAGLGAAGLRTSALAPALGTMQVSPVGAEQVAALRAVPGVADAQPTRGLTLTANDPYPNQGALDQMHVEQGWATTSSQPVHVAVIDSGIDTVHRDLNGRVGAGYDALNDRPIAAGRRSARGSHGTAVAGLIAATADNGAETAGINRGAVVHPVRPAGADSCISDAGIAAGLQWAADRGDIDVANISIGGPYDNPVIRSAVRYAQDRDVLVVASVGNDGTTEPNYPAAYADVVGVGAVGPDGRVTGYSQRAAVDLVAPGGGDLFEDGLVVYANYEQLELASGTSFATPYVAGAASLWRGLHPQAGWRDAAQALTATARRLPSESAAAAGAGILDLAALLGGAPAPQPTASPTPQPTPSPDPTVQPAAAPPAPPAFDGTGTSAGRLNTDDPFRAAVQVSQQRFGDGAAQIAVVARHDAFADALSASSLTADGPLHFVFGGTSGNARDDRGLPDFVRNELLRAVADGGTVYVVSGPGAVSQTIFNRLQETNPTWTVRRLAGSDRFATSALIAAEQAARNPGHDKVLVARGFGPDADPNGTAAWADAITAGAFAARHRVPLLLVPTRQLDPIHEEAVYQLTRHQPLVVLLGGTSAVSAKVADQVGAITPNVARASGTDRHGTAAKVHDNLWRRAVDVQRNVLLLNPHDRNSWTLGLLGAGIGADHDAPVLTVGITDVPAPTVARARHCGSHGVGVYVLGSTLQVSDGQFGLVEAQDGRAC